MRSKTKGASRRNLHVWRKSIWYQRVVGGRRFHVDTKRPATAEGWRQAVLFHVKASETGQQPLLELRYQIPRVVFRGNVQTLSKIVVKNDSGAPVTLTSSATMRVEERVNCGPDSVARKVHTLRRWAMT